MDCCETIKRKVLRYMAASLTAVAVSVAAGSALVYYGQAPLYLKVAEALVIASVAVFTVFYIIPWVRGFSKAACSKVCDRCKGTVRVNMWRAVVSCINGESGVCYNHVSGSTYKVTGLDGPVKPTGDLGCVKATRIDEATMQGRVLIVRGEGIFRHGGEARVWRGRVVVEEN